MTEAKDTVMKCDTSLTCCLDCHEAQAEPSFKAGEKQGIEKGRREVVEFLEANYNSASLRAVLQAKLKDWGISDGS